MERPIFKVTCQAKLDNSLWPYVKINDGGLLMLLMLLMLLNVANVTHGGGYNLEFVAAVLHRVFPYEVSYIV